MVVRLDMKKDILLEMCCELLSNKCTLSRHDKLASRCINTCCNVLAILWVGLTLRDGQFKRSGLRGVIKTLGVGVVEAISLDL